MAHHPTQDADVGASPSQLDQQADMSGLSDDCFQLSPSTMFQAEEDLQLPQIGQDFLSLQGGHDPMYPRAASLPGDLYQAPAPDIVHASGGGPHLWNDAQAGSAPEKLIEYIDLSMTAMNLVFLKWSETRDPTTKVMSEWAETVSKRVRMPYGAEHISSLVNTFNGCLRNQVLWQDPTQLATPGLSQRVGPSSIAIIAKESMEMGDRHQQHQGEKRSNESPLAPNAPFTKRARRRVADAFPPYSESQEPQMVQRNRKLPKLHGMTIEPCKECPFYCVICVELMNRRRKQFSVGNLKQHIRRAHTWPHHYVCNEVDPTKAQRSKKDEDKDRCSKKYKDKGHFRDHITGTHIPQYRVDELRIEAQIEGCRVVKSRPESCPVPGCGWIPNSNEETDLFYKNFRAHLLECMINRQEGLGCAVCHNKNHDGRPSDDEGDDDSSSRDGHNHGNSGNKSRRTNGDSTKDHSNSQDGKSSNGEDRDGNEGQRDGGDDDDDNDEDDDDQTGGGQTVCCRMDEPQSSGPTAKIGGIQQKGYRNTTTLSPTLIKRPFGSIYTSIVVAEKHWNTIDQRIDVQYLRRLGQGGYSVVDAVLASSGHSAERTLAWKSVSKSNVMHRDQYKNERDVLQHLQRQAKPHVIKLHGSYQSRTHYHLLMEPVADQDLSQFMRQMRADQFYDSAQRASMHAQILSIMSCMASGVASLHEAGVVHHDLKPSNILLVDSKALITDFGGSIRKSHGLSLRNLRIGTPQYCAPELWLENGKWTPACDIWSLGAILQELIILLCKSHSADIEPLLQENGGVVSFGRLPRSIVSGLELHQEESLELASYSAMYDFVLEMLDKDPARRPSAAEVVCRFPACHCDISHISARHRALSNLRLQVKRGRWSSRHRRQCSFDAQKYHYPQVSRSLMFSLSSQRDRSWSQTALSLSASVSSGQFAQMKSSRRSDNLSASGSPQIERKFGGNSGKGISPELLQDQTDGTRPRKSQSCAVSSSSKTSNLKRWLGQRTEDDPWNALSMSLSDRRTEVWQMLHLGESYLYSQKQATGSGKTRKAI